MTLFQITSHSNLSLIDGNLIFDSCWYNLSVLRYHLKKFKADYSRKVSNPVNLSVLGMKKFVSKRGVIKLSSLLYFRNLRYPFQKSLKTSLATQSYVLYVLLYGMKSFVEWGVENHGYALVLDRTYGTHSSLIHIVHRSSSSVGSMFSHGPSIGSRSLPDNTYSLWISI